MSVTTLLYNRVIESVAVDADSVTLCDPTSTFGVQRKDNNGVVIAAGTPFVKTGTGQYQFAFTDPAPNLIYRYVVKVIADGQTTYLERESSILPSPIGYDGRYASYLGMIQKFGRIAVTRWAEINGSVDADATMAAVQNAVDNADAWVDTYLNGGAYDVPFTSPTPGIPRLIKEIANIMAGYLLYEAQGMIDSDPDIESVNRLATMRAGALREIARIKSGRLRLLTDAGVDLAYYANTPIAGAFEEFSPQYISPTYFWNIDP